MASLVLGLSALIAPSDPNLLYVGRFDWSNKANPTCEWPASEVRLRVHGSSFVAKFDDHSGCGWEKVVDGKDEGVLQLKKGPASYTIDLGSEADHEIRVVRRTEAFTGPTQILGFEIPNGRLLKARSERRHIQVVGDSITCGYGDEGKDQHEHFKPETENAYASYASVGARLVKADVEIIAWSGRKMWPDNTTPEIYDCILPTQSKPVYDFRGPTPEAVVINLATNDFGKQAPEEAGWTGAYEQFIRRVWSHYSKAQIYLASGSMMFGAQLATLKTYLTKIKEDMHDPRVHILEFDTQKEEDGFGSDWHPSIKTQEKMGAKLAETLRRDLGW